MDNKHPSTKMAQSWDSEDPLVLTSVAVLLTVGILLLLLVVLLS